MTALDRFRDWFSGAEIAHLATVTADGAPTSVPIWVGIEGDRLVFQTMATSQKARNLAHEPRVALSLTKADDPFSAATVRGRVVERREDAGIWQVIDRISRAYIGQDYGDREHPRVVYYVDVDSAVVHAF
jgi:PPOX class probable F420-dependent enzyme